MGYEMYRLLFSRKGYMVDVKVKKPKKFFVFFVVIDVDEEDKNKEFFVGKWIVDFVMRSCEVI